MKIETTTEQVNQFAMAALKPRLDAAPLSQKGNVEYADLRIWLSHVVFAEPITALTEKKDPIDRDISDAPCCTSYRPWN